MYVHEMPNMPGGPLVVGGGGSDLVEIHIFSTFAPDLRSVETPIFNNTVNATVDAIGLTFVALYAGKAPSCADPFSGSARTQL